MTTLGQLLSIAALVVAVIAAVGWAQHEGFRQGDEPGDSETSVRLDPQLDGSFVVKVKLDNQAAVPVLASATSRWIPRLRPMPGVGRTTRRRFGCPLEGALLAVDGMGSDTVTWVAPPPTARRRLVVDVHVWQCPDRLRRHRRVLSVS